MTRDKWDEIRFNGLDGCLLLHGEEIIVTVRRTQWKRGTLSDRIIKGMLDYTNQRGMRVGDSGINYKFIRSIGRTKPANAVS